MMNKYKRGDMVIVNLEDDEHRHLVITNDNWEAAGRVYEFIDLDGSLVVQVSGHMFNVSIDDVMPMPEQVIPPNKRYERFNEFENVLVHFGKHLAYLHGFFGDVPDFDQLPTMNEDEQVVGKIVSYEPANNMYTVAIQRKTWKIHPAYIEKAKFVSAKPIQMVANDMFVQDYIKRAVTMNDKWQMKRTDTTTYDLYAEGQYFKITTMDVPMLFIMLSGAEVKTEQDANISDWLQGSIKVPEFMKAWDETESKIKRAHMVGEWIKEVVNETA